MFSSLCKVTTMATFQRSNSQTMLVNIYSFALLYPCTSALLHYYTYTTLTAALLYYFCWIAILYQFCNVLLLHCCTIVLLCHVSCLDTLWRKKQTKIRIILPTYIMANNVRSHCLRNLEHWRIFIRLIFIRRISALAITRSTLWRSHDAGDCSQPRVQYLLTFY